MATYRAGRNSRARRDWRGGWPFVLILFALGGLGGAIVGAFPEFSLSRILLDPPVTSSGVTVIAAFPICAGGARLTCVVDGDTFWLDGAKIRIADINTPETGQPGCASEAALGRAATTRLTELLNEGPFELVTADRDEDRYGRKLRIVERGGRSLGDVLVEEGLAHHWRGYQESWC